MSRAVVGAFPSASVIDVGEIITRVGTLLGQMSAAILLAASVAILAGIAVLIGAIAASRAARSYDSVILKTLGATRWQVLGAQALEYALLAAVLALVSLGLGARRRLVRDRADLRVRLGARLGNGARHAGGGRGADAGHRAARLAADLVDPAGAGVAAVVRGAASLSAY